MVVGFANVTRSSPDLESGVVSNVCRPPPLLRAPQTKESWDILGDTGDCWGIRESTRVVQQTIMYFLSTQDNGWNHVIMDINGMWVSLTLSCPTLPCLTSCHESSEPCYANILFR